eukprot:PLAT394.1.p1 GENE.PLAT394.1~~PLAT394.1.p1  ORF type:complete len:242 (+),score=26.17 PLAT394.1:47-772(+)
MGAGGSKEALKSALADKDVKRLQGYVRRAGKDAEVQLGWAQAAVIVHCAKADFTEGVRWLIEEGADVNAGASGGHTALHEARSAAVADALLAAGADVEGGEGQHRPLHTASFEGRDAVVATLIRARATVDAVDKQGYTPLMKACVSGMVRCAQLLLAAGADTTLKDKLYKKTPAELAAEYNNADVVAALEAAETGRSALAAEMEVVSKLVVEADGSTAASGGGAAGPEAVGAVGADTAWML